MYFCKFSDASLKTVRYKNATANVYLLISKKWPWFTAKVLGFVLRLIWVRPGFDQFIPA